MEELLLALLGDYVEAVDHIGLSYFEERRAWWLDVCKLSDPNDWPDEWVAKKWYVKPERPSTST